MTDPKPTPPSPSAAPAPNLPTDIALAMQQALQALTPTGAAGIGAPQNQPLWGNDLLAALTGTSMDVSGRYGQTGSPYSGVLPPWAQGLPQQVYNSPDWDPYLGIVSQGGDERVFMGSHDVTKTAGGRPANKFSSEFAPDQTRGGEPVMTSSPDTLTVTQAMNLPYTWDEQEVADAMQRLRQAGLKIDSFDSTDGATSVVGAWQMLVQRAAAMYDLSGGKKEVTPWDVLDLYKNERQSLGLPDPNGSVTNVTRSVTDITEGQAFEAQQSILQTLLGRDPSDQEVRDFLYRSNRLAAENPQITKTVTSYKNGEAVGTTSHTDPGYTSADMAMDAYKTAQDDPDYAEFRGASYLYNAVLSALGPIGG